MNMPMVSCICPTYNRPPMHLHLLAEAVESFVRQTYPDERMELIIANDTPGQTLTCDVPGVRCINTDTRYSSVGAKYNDMIENYAKGSIIFPWDDDDISLPGRIMQAFQWLEGGRCGYDYFNPQRSWFKHGKNLQWKHSHGYCHNASAYRKTAWQHAGLYPDLAVAYDAGMDQRLKTSGAMVAPPLDDDPRTWTYIYRWGTSPCHISGYGGTDAEAYAKVGKRPIEAGRFLIEPAWKEDYSEGCAEVCRLLDFQT